ncbi:MAG: hypothetical protein MUD04_09760 [Cyanobium sp. Prado107]|nr:hypothetical protein [Cyanobium sp. Prado107]
MATDHEISHGRDITWMLRAKAVPVHIAESWIGTGWIVEVAATGTRDGKPFQATHLIVSSLRTTPEALLQQVRDRLITQMDAPPWHGCGPWRFRPDPAAFRLVNRAALAVSRVASPP